MRNLKIIVLAFCSFFLLSLNAQSVFVHKTSTANTKRHMTTLNHASVNGQANKLLFISQRYGQYNNHQVGVYYEQGKWKIYNEDIATMPNNTNFNVLAVQASDKAFLHKATTQNIKGHWTTINHPKCNNNPNAVLIVTQNWKGAYNPKPIGVFYNSGRWAIYNQDKSVMPENMAFNVLVQSEGEKSGIGNSTVFIHQKDKSTSSKKWGDYITHTGLKEIGATLFITQNWKTNGPYNTHIPGVWFEGNAQQWTIFNQDKKGFPNNAKFNVVAFGAANPTQEDMSGFHMILASDPQYPRVPSGMDESSAQKKESEKLNRDHVTSMNKFVQQKSTVKGVIINGDLTEYGHLYQLRKFKEIYNDLKVPMYLGLGNHDYMNNVGNTFSNQAANRMVEYMIEHIEGNGISSKDYTQSKSYKFPEIVRTINGSLSYSWDVDNVHFVQLQNFPVYERNWSDFLGSDAERKTVNIKNSLEWLETDLANARRAGKVIILNYHDSDENWSNEGGTTTMINEFTDMLFRYHVSAVFVGHYHATIGEHTVPNNHANYYEKNGTKIPVLYCGSAVNSKYLLVKFLENQMIVENVSSLNGGNTTSNRRTYTLRHPKVNVPMPATSGAITFFNEAGYVAKYELSYTQKGKSVKKNTGNIALGNKVRYEIPKDATNIWVKGEGQTGLLWDPWNQTFNEKVANTPTGLNKCYKSYGTTLSQKWNNNCK